MEFRFTGQITKVTKVSLTDPNGSPIRIGFEHYFCVHWAILRKSYIVSFQVGGSSPISFSYLSRASLQTEYVAVDQ